MVSRLKYAKTQSLTMNHKNTDLLIYIILQLIINGSYVDIYIFFTALITISRVFICMSHVTYHWTHSYTTLTASMAGRVVNLLIRATNSRKALAITVTRGVAGVGVTVNDTGGKYARGKYYNILRTVLL